MGGFFFQRPRGLDAPAQHLGDHAVGMLLGRRTNRTDLRDLRNAWPGINETIHSTRPHRVERPEAVRRTTRRTALFFSRTPRNRQVKYARSACAAGISQLRKASGYYI
jgi:hypothetical protein